MSSCASPASQETWPEPWRRIDVPSDWKPEPRTKDPEALRRFRLAHVNEPCDVDGCGRQGIHIHHSTFRSQGGGDVPENLQWLCGFHHDEVHGVRSVW